MIESVAYDLLRLLEQDKGVRHIGGVASNQYVFRMSWLHPPFNNAKVRRAAFVALRQQHCLAVRGRQSAVLAHGQGTVYVRFRWRELASWED